MKSMCRNTGCRMKLLTAVDAQIKEADDDVHEVNEQAISNYYYCLHDYI